MAWNGAGERPDWFLDGAPSCRSTPTGDTGSDAPSAAPSPVSPPSASPPPEWPPAKPGGHEDGGDGALPFGRLRWGQPWPTVVVARSVASRPDLAQMLGGHRSAAGQLWLEVTASGGLKTRFGKGGVLRRRQRRGSIDGDVGVGEAGSLARRRRYTRGGLARDGAAAAGAWVAGAPSCHPDLATTATSWAVVAVGVGGATGGL
uniref:Uncharacterized protein n=1 Tax=Leersia perrieri TaxID=77586 RepID=A0A0D9WHD3_9ORYZ